MTVRLQCNVKDTKELLGAILRVTNNGDRCMFLVGPGEGDAAIQRAKVKLSRVRANLKNQGKRRKYFNLHHTVHPHTENGKRGDMVVVWQTKQTTHVMLETLEDLVGHGEQL